MDQLTRLPARFTAGDTFDLLLSETDYPAGDGWTLKLALRAYGLAPIDIDSTASGDAHLFQVAADSSAGPPAVVGTDAWAAGTYTAYTYASDGTRRFQIGKTTIIVDPDPTALTASSDNRSHARTMLDAIEAVLRGLATHSQQKVTVDTGTGSRALEHCSRVELEQMRARYQQEVATEDAIANGGQVGRRIVVCL